MIIKDLDYLEQSEQASEISGAAAPTGTLFFQASGTATQLLLGPLVVNKDADTVSFETGVDFGQAININFDPGAFFFQIDLSPLFPPTP
jgi:hypothetical protein